MHSRKHSRRSTGRRAAAFLLLTMLAMSQPSLATDPVFDHSEWSAVLAKFVDPTGRVDYAGLAEDRAELDRYIAVIEKTSPDTEPALFPNKNAELAFWMNAYNAQVFLGVLDLGVDIDSVWAGLISGRNFFIKRKIVVGGERMSLKAFEDDIIRDRYKDARIHAAINCASIGCPRLPQVAFKPAQLDQQLDAAMREFVNSEQHVQVDPAESTVRVSKIFDWFKRDFEHDAESVLAYINRYRAQQIPANYRLEHLRYDKGLNRQ